MKQHESPPEQDRKTSTNKDGRGRTLNFPRQDGRLAAGPGAPQCQSKRRALPAPVDPLLQVRGLASDGGVGAMTGQHQRLG